MNDNNSSQIAKKLAGSALSQKGTSNQTGSKMEDTASNVLKSWECKGYKNISGLHTFPVK